VVNGPAQEELALVVAMTLFCNVFSHHLIALSDEEFLQHYTTAQGSQVILAEHVKVHLRTMLHDLYWNKPVLAADNSLSERWCRLVRRAPFCQELPFLVFMIGRIVMMRVV
jgi:hypothetical protein